MELYIYNSSTHKVSLKVKVLVIQLCLTLCDPMDYIPPGSLSMEFSKEEYWEWVACLSPGDLPNRGIEPVSPALTGGFLTTSTTQEAHIEAYIAYIDK